MCDEKLFGQEEYPDFWKSIRQSQEIADKADEIAAACAEAESMLRMWIQSPASIIIGGDSSLSFRTVNARCTAGARSWGRKRNLEKCPGNLDTSKRHKHPLFLVRPAVVTFREVVNEILPGWEIVDCTSEGGEIGETTDKLLRDCAGVVTKPATVSENRNELASSRLVGESRTTHTLRK